VLHLFRKALIWQLLDAFAASSHRSIPRWRLFRTGAVLLFFGNALVALLRGDAFAAHRIAAYRAGICLVPTESCSSSARRLTRPLLDAFPASSHCSIPRWHLLEPALCYSSSAMR
jgi:hypothetical protein